MLTSTQMLSESRSSPTKPAMLNIKLSFATDVSNNENSKEENYGNVARTSGAVTQNFDCGKLGPTKGE